MENENSPRPVGLGQLFVIAILIVVLSLSAIAVWGPAIALNIYQTAKAGLPEKQLFDLRTSNGSVTCKWVERGAMVYSKADVLCDQPATFYSFRSGDQWRARQDELDQKRSGSIAQSIASEVFAKVKGVNTLQFGQRSSGGAWLVDRYMLYIGISPGYEDRQEKVLSAVAEIVSQVQTETKK